VSEMGRMLLVQGIAAAKAGDKSEAREYLERLLLADPDEHQLVEAWLWLADVCEDEDEKREYLEYVIGYEPWNPRARRGLAILNGLLDPADVIDPNRPRPAPAAQPGDARSRRYVCQQCGGTMSFSAGDERLSCGYCGRQISLLQALDEGELQEREFVVALATAKGHGQPVATRAFACQGCGAAYLLGPEVVSLTCPYCASTHVLEQPETRDLIAPQGIIPMAVTEERARSALTGWLGQKGLRREALTGAMGGVYIPAWTFDVGGELRWRGAVVEQAGGRRVRLAERSGSVPIFFDDIVVPASHTLAADLMKEANGFDLGALVPYDPGYLAGWPAEAYQVPVSDASLVARRIAWERSRGDVDGQLLAEDQISDLSLSSAGMAILSYKLILLPFWLARYRMAKQVPPNDEPFSVVINGQTGAVRGQTPRGKLRRFLDSLLE